VRFWLNCQEPRGLSMVPTLPIAALSVCEVRPPGPAILIALSSTAAASNEAIANVVGIRLYVFWYSDANLRLAGLSRSGE
jgi:hypothetical protein